MTILPKKKHHDSKKNEQDHDSDSRNRHRNRAHRDSRVGRTHSSPEDLDVETSPSPKYSDLDLRETQESSVLPTKRSRHNRDRQQNFYSTTTSHSNVSISRRNSREGSKSPNDNNEDNEDGYNSSDEHVPPDNSKV